MESSSGPRLLVFSDIHADDSSFPEPIVANAPSGTLGRSSWIDFADTQQQTDPLESFTQIVKNEKITADYLIVPGDVCNKANGKALRIAWEKLQGIMNGLGAKEIIATVGNHDLDSRYRRHTYDPKDSLRRLRPLFPTAARADYNAFWATGLTVLPRGDTRFLVLNSCEFHTGKPEELEHGRLGPEALDELLATLRASTNFRFNVAICHHSPIPFAGGAEGPEDYMRNGENMLQALNLDHNRWLVLHGHRHTARVQYGPGDFGAPILFSAGSVGARIPAALNLKLRNQAHLISLQADVSPEIPLGGDILTWDYTVDVGWTHALRLDGLPSRCGFGHRGEPAVLAERAAVFLDGQAGPTPWQSVVSAVPELPFLTPHGFVAFTRVLEDRFRFRLLPTLDDPQEVARVSP